MRLLHCFDYVTGGAWARTRLRFALTSQSPQNKRAVARGHPKRTFLRPTDLSDTAARNTIGAQNRNSAARDVEATSSTPSTRQELHKVPLECSVPGHGKRQINQRLDFLVQRRRGEGPLLRDGIGRRERYLLPLFHFRRI